MKPCSPSPSTLAGAVAAVLPSLAGAVAAAALLGACAGNEPPPRAPSSAFTPPSLAPGGVLPPFGPGWPSPGAAPSLPPGLARAGLPVDLLNGAPWQAVAGACGAGLARVVLGAGRTLALPCDLPLPPGAPLPRLPVLRGPLPPATDLVALGLDGRVKDQAQVGVCGYFAMTTALENGLRRAGVRDEISPLHVIAAGAWNDLFARPSTRYLAPEVALPYDPAKACELGPEPDEGDCSHTYGVAFNSWRSNPRLVEAVGRADARGAYAGVLVDRLSGDPDEIAGEIARGRSVYVSLAIDGDAWSGGAVDGGAIPEHARGASAHAVVLTAYQVTPGGRFFLVHNSWGADWGRGGYAWLSEANLRRNFKHAFLVDAYLRGMPVPAKRGEGAGTPTATPSVPVLPGAAPLPIGAARPNLPPAAALPSVPNLPPAAALPPVPKLPPATGLPSVPNLPPATGLPSMPKLPGVLGVPGAPAACSTPLVAGLCLPRPPRPLL